ncbi:hypothetical protein [Streptomyces sp. NPDC050856]|uniref:hypothetical protein n=1 Tax=Streptomyces sp. NPDC050856 TaxID=3154939 RepID=UPI0033EC6E85
MNGDWAHIEVDDRHPDTTAEPPPAAGPWSGAADPQPGLLVTLAVEDGTTPFSEAIDEQLEAVTAWWHAKAPHGPGFVQVHTRAPRNRHDVERFLDQAQLRDVEPDVPLVLFLTGHGLAGARHYLLLPDTERDRLLATALPTSEIVTAALDSCAQDVLVVVNMCEAASVGRELWDLQRDLAHSRLTAATLNVLATTGDRTAVLGREFALILQEAHAWLRSAGGITRPYLTMAEFVEALDHATRTLNERHRRRLEGPRPVLTGKLHEPTTTLPNPGYRPRPPVVARSRQEVAATYEELEYWLDKASGRTGPDDPGWYFSGRQALNQEVTGFLHGPCGALIVTGGAASGKSAVLGRAVTLSDPAFRTSERYAAAVRHSPPATVPAEGAVTVAVTARNRDSLDLLRALGGGLGAAPDPSAEDDVRGRQAALRAFFEVPGPMVTVVVDALDEATDPARCVTDVLAPLAVHTSHPEAELRGRGLRLLLGVRSATPSSTTDPAPPTDATDGTDAGATAATATAARAARAASGAGVGTVSAGVAHRDLPALLRAAFPGAREVRTDGPGVREDIAGYVRALLEGADGWSEQEVSRVATDVAARVDRSFLDARLAAEQLRAGGPGLPADPAWSAQLDRGTVGLLQTDLERGARTGLPADEALALLRATAFALGRGMPWGEVWPAVAAAVHRSPIDRADEKIELLLTGPLSGYLTHDSEDDRVVYRPAHDRLGRVLRCWPGAGVSRGGTT